MKDGWKLEIVAPKTLIFPSGESAADPPQPEDPPIHYLNLIGQNPRTYHFESLISLIEGKRPRIILLDNDPVSRQAIQLGRWAKKNNARLFCVSNENLPLDIPSAVRRRGWKAFPAAIIKRVMLKQTKKLADGVFTINHDGEKLFKKEGYLNVRHMPLGFDPDYFYPDPESRLKVRSKLNLRDKVIAYFGRLTTEKGIHILIRALGELKQYPWQLLMDSFDPYATPYHTEIKQLLQQVGIVNRVVFINPTHKEIAAYMNAADIVVVPSITTPTWKEQYGRVAAEAMACGKIVIASDSGALRDLLGGHGYIFEEGNSSALKDILKILLSEDGKDNINELDISTYAMENLSIRKQKAVLEEAFQ